MNHAELVEGQVFYLTPAELPRRGPVTVAVTAHTLNLVGSCDRICDQATLGIAEKQPIQIGFEKRQAMQVVDFT